MEWKSQTGWAELYFLSEPLGLRDTTLSIATLVGPLGPKMTAKLEVIVSHSTNNQVCNDIFKNYKYNQI